jgi:hypothetical protein
LHQVNEVDFGGAGAQVESQSSDACDGVNDEVKTWQAATKRKTNLHSIRHIDGSSSARAEASCSAKKKLEQRTSRSFWIRPAVAVSMQVATGMAAQESPN